MRVLIADDETVIRMDLQELLQELGHDVVASVGNGFEAIEQARLLLPDLMILDIKMPLKDGISAAELIFKENLGPVILLTAYSDKHLISKAGRAGVYAYLIKPFSEADINSAVSIAVARHREVCSLKEQAVELQQSLKERKLIERAKGIIMKINSVSEEAAFDYLRRRSRISGKSMSAVAAEIIGKNP